MKSMKKVLRLSHASTYSFMLHDLKLQAYAWPIMIYVVNRICHSYMTTAQRERV